MFILPLINIKPDNKCYEDKVLILTTYCWNNKKTNLQKVS